MMEQITPDKVKGTDFDSFSVMVIQSVFNSIDKVLDDLSSVNSFAVTKNEMNDLWEYSLGVRIGKQWYQHLKTLPPVQYDIYNLPDPMELNGNIPPSTMAHNVAMELLEGVKAQYEL